MSSCEFDGLVATELPLSDLIPVSDAEPSSAVHLEGSNAQIAFGPDGGCALAVHVVCGADSMSDYSWMGTMAGKVVLVCNDASKALRESGVPIVRVSRLTKEAMAKCLFHDLAWDAAVATRAAHQAEGDWNQLKSQLALCSTSPEAACAQGGKDDFSLCSAPPGFVANQVLNGAAPTDCVTDARVVAWVDANLGLHCASMEDMARKQELMATSAGWCSDGNPIGPELFVRAARHGAARVQYADGKYRNPWGA